ncbi:MAG TPA: PKD domain-containing protein [Bacteroidia bacterium]|jgi:gliding motility-associated-like protein|nr:PKD domain-containing protein [Bacteroidia bacterium]
MKKSILFILLFVTGALFSGIAGETPKNNWTIKKPFDQRVFIQNNGQFFAEGKLQEQNILFGSREGSLHYFFTKNGLTIMNYRRVKRTEREIEQLMEKFNIREEKKRKGEEEKEFSHKMVPEFHQMEWQNANPNVELITEEQTTDYYSYPDAKRPNENINIRAAAFKKLTYKNLYPNIDVEFYFPEDKEGYKYNIILHPGADASQIQMLYAEEKLFVDATNDLQIQSPFGNFTDHSPIAQTASGKNLNCFFLLKKNTVSFSLPSNTITEETIIDPWTTNPLMITWNKGYDVDFDNGGNVYINGGSYPYQIKKYNAGGVLQWTFSCASFTPYSGTDAFYGDFAIDRRSGSSYATEGFNFSGAKVIKVNTAGVNTANYAGTPNFTEMWRIAFSRCTNQAVIVGGGVSSPTHHGCYLDTNLANLSPVTLNGTGQTGDDIALLALDNFGNGYILASSWNGMGTLSDKLVKLTLPGLLPIQYMVTAGYNIIELSSYYVQPSGSGLSGYAIGNGINGLTTSNTNVYSYDSFVLKKWNGPNGAQLGYKRVNFPANNDSSKIHWSGITSDDCDNVFVGSMNKVIQYNANLNVIATTNMTDTVFDVMLGKNGNLYTTGRGFLSSTPVNILPCSVMHVTDSVNNATCTSPVGSATITVTGGTGPYTITWNTTPVQTGSVVTGLGAGTYVATISDNSCVTLMAYDTIVISQTGNFTTNPVITNVSCNGGNNGSINLNVVATGTIVPTYTWSTGVHTQNVNGLSAGQYTVAISDGTCTSTLSLTVTQPPPITSTLTPGIIKCFGDTASIIISVSGGTPTYTIAWNTTPAQTGNSAHGLGAGTYTGGIVDTKGCTATFTSTLTQPPRVVSSFTTNASCFGSPMQFTDQSTGGPFTTWNWAFGDGGTSTIQNPAHTYTATGTYVVNFTVTTAAGCSATVSQNVTISPQLTVVYKADTVCLGQLTTFTDLTAGVPGGSSYNWTFGDATSSIQPTTVGHAYQGAGTYTTTLTITNGQGCVSSATISVLVKPIPIVNAVPDVEYCPRINTAAINFTSTPAGSTFNWTNSNAGIGLATSGTGNIVSFVTVNANTTAINGTILVHATLNGCVGPDSNFVITINPNPKASFIAGTKICEGTPMNFTDLSSIGSGSVTQWDWDLDGNGIYNNSTSNHPQYTFPTAGIHTVGLIAISNKLCSDTITETVYVNYQPVPAFTGDNLSGCPVLNVNFTDNSTIQAGHITGWNWNFGNGITATTQFPQTISYNNTSATVIANYSVTLTVTSDSGCVTTLTKPNYITVYPHPQPGFYFGALDGDIDIIDPTVHFYDASLGATSINWYLGDIFTPNQASNYTSVINPVHSYWYDQPYTYYVTQHVSNTWGCKDSITKPVEVKPNYTFYIPNAFTPDGDNLNDGFKGTGIGIDNTTYSLMIFDRWGNLIFTANDIDKAWDGRIKKDGDIVQEDVYVWKVSFKDMRGMKHQYSGTVSLLK